MDMSRAKWTVWQFYFRIERHSIQIVWAFYFIKVQAFYPLWYSYGVPMDMHRTGWTVQQFYR